jgi:hypothetical protein
MRAHRLRRRGGIAATLHGGVWEERKEEWSVGSGEEEEVAMAAAAAAAAPALRWLLLVGFGFRPGPDGGHPERRPEGGGGHGSFAPHVSGFSSGCG